jgi:hypothetical protein
MAAVLSLSFNLSIVSRSVLRVGAVELGREHLDALDVDACAASSSPCADASLPFSFSSSRSSWRT